VRNRIKNASKQFGGDRVARFAPAAFHPEMEARPVLRKGRVLGGGAPASPYNQALGRRSARGSSSKIAKPTATRCSLPSMLTLTFMTYWIRPSIRAGRGDHQGSRVYEAYNSKHVLVLTRLSQSVSS
jgi:hypothetical protein